jgi:hypothetical protein
MRATFQDLNAVAAHALASLLCPARLRPVSAHPEVVCIPARLGDSRMTPPLRSHHSMRSSKPTPSPNSAQALAHAPVKFERAVVLGDILSQVLVHIL